MLLRERLAELRKARGFTLRELRERIQDRTGERMSVSYLSELERLEMTPSVEVLTRIAMGYDMTFQDLIGPIELGDLAPPSHYPQSLQEYARLVDISDEDLAALSRVEFRGHRPSSVDEWRLLHSTLMMFRKEERP